MCDKMWVVLRKFTFICTAMFPYNDTEIAWINKPKNASNTKNLKGSLAYTLLFALSAAVFSTTIPSIIYFLRIF